MPNKNYVKGVRKERRIKHELERDGFIVLRTAGSHGFADLIAIDKETNIIRFIQCKPDNFSPGEVAKLKEEHSRYNLYNTWQTTFEVI